MVPGCIRDCNSHAAGNPEEVELKGALSGIGVLDLSGGGPASIAARILGDMGADVIAINSPPGAKSKGVGAGVPFMKGVDAPVHLDSLRNTKNVGINLKSPEGQRLFQELALTTDVVIESFRPGVMDRLGLGYDILSQRNPRIIFCSVTGYGQEGPYRDLPGHDANYAAMGGVLGLIGYSPDSPPVLVQNFLADVTAAVLWVTVGILLAVRARELTGRGQRVDVSMTDGVTFLLSSIPEVGEYFLRGIVPQRGSTFLGGSHPSYAVYQTADKKWLTIGALEPHFWRNLCQALRREDLTAKQYASSPTKEEVFDELRTIFKTKTRDEWFEQLSAADVPVGKVLDMDEVFSDPHLAERGMMVELDHPRWGRIRQIGLPIRLSDTPWEVRIPPARLGDQTNEVMTDLGYSKDDIERLRHKGVIC
jgi:crotonobetainyl-CoA:carnitine CoA-transferase CaiB-like acyl-CoA transferase